MRDARRGDFIDTETIEAISHGAPDTHHHTGRHR